MMFAHSAFWGMLATVIFTTMIVGSQGLGFTRLNVPFMLGSMVTADRDRARVYGVGMHLAIGVAFSWLYLLAFYLWGGASWWRGAILGGVHAAFFLTIVTTLLPGLHPRMANEQQGPTAMRQLEPPGFLAMHYGLMTPLSILAAHLVFGVILGGALPQAP